MKIVFDFDGVVTDQTEEALRVREIFFEKIIVSARELGIDIKSTLDELGKELNKSPQNHGWKFLSEITAFSDEDLFVWNNALAAFLDEKADFDQNIQKIKQNLIDKGYSDFKFLANFAFDQLVKETKAGTFKPIEQSGALALQQLLNLGNSIVIVSNSGTDRIISLLKSHDLPVEDHQNNPNARLRVRGNARKFELSDKKVEISVHNRTILVNRPTYEKILLEEMPNAVVGDVFSLDLALPFYLSLQKEQLSDMKLFLRLREYTPKWILEASSSISQLTSINNLQEIAGLI